MGWFIPLLIGAYLFGGKSETRTETSYDFWMWIDCGHCDKYRVAIHYNRDWAYGEEGAKRPVWYPTEGSPHYPSAKEVDETFGYKLKEIKLKEGK